MHWCLTSSGPEVLLKTCVAMKFVDDDDDDRDQSLTRGSKLGWVVLPGYGFGTHFLCITFGG